MRDTASAIVLYLGNFSRKRNLKVENVNESSEQSTGKKIIRQLNTLSG